MPQTKKPPQKQPQKPHSPAKTTPLPAIQHPKWNDAFSPPWFSRQQGAVKNHIRFTISTRDKYIIQSVIACVLKTSIGTAVAIGMKGSFFRKKCLTIDYTNSNILFFA
jgi:hypothetical protein